MTKPKRKRPKTVTIPRRFLAPIRPLRILFRSIALGLMFSALWLSGFSAIASPAGKKPEKPYALIFGTVWGPDNRPLYGVKIKVRRADEKKARWELFSDHSGEFAVRVPAGQADYLVRADLKGYKYLDGKHLEQPEEIKVHIDNDERADIGLHLK